MEGELELGYEEEQPKTKMKIVLKKLVADDSASRLWLVEMNRTRKKECGHLCLLTCSLLLLSPYFYEGGHHILSFLDEAPFVPQYLWVFRAKATHHSFLRSSSKTPKQKN